MRKNFTDFFENKKFVKLNWFIWFHKFFVWTFLPTVWTYVDFFKLLYSIHIWNDKQQHKFLCKIKFLKNVENEGENYCFHRQMLLVVHNELHKLLCSVLYNYDKIKSRNTKWLDILKIVSEPIFKIYSELRKCQYDLCCIYPDPVQELKLLRN